MMSRNKLCVLLLVMLFAASGDAMAQDWTDVELSVTKDSHMILAFGGGTNKGNGGMFYFEDDDTALYQWDVSGVVVPDGKEIRGASIELYSCDMGPYHWDYRIRCYPMRAPWQEGVGIPNDGYGGKGWPWGPTSVGDATYNWSSVATVGLGVDPFHLYTVGLTGTPWETPGGLGTTSDCYPRLMSDAYTEGAQGSYPEGVSYGLWPMTDEGLLVIQEWMANTLDNNGLVLQHVNTANQPEGDDWCNIRPCALERAPATAPRLWIHMGPPAPPYLPGEAHSPGEVGYGAVDGADYTAWADNYSTTDSRPTWRMGGWTVGNWTDDNFTDGADYTAWADNYSPLAAVPEPATMALLALGAIALIRRRR